MACCLHVHNVIRSTSGSSVNQGLVKVFKIVCLRTTQNAKILLLLECSYCLLVLVNDLITRCLIWIFAYRVSELRKKTYPAKKISCPGVAESPFFVPHYGRGSLTSDSKL